MWLVLLLAFSPLDADMMGVGVLMTPLGSGAGGSGPPPSTVLTNDAGTITLTNDAGTLTLTPS